MVAELGFTTVKEVSSINAAISAISEPWSMAVVELCLTEGCAIEWVELLRGMGDPRPILVHTASNDTNLATLAFKAKVNGYIHKSKSDAEILEAIRTVDSGAYYVEPEYAVRLAMSSGEQTDPPRHSKLTEREHKVMIMVARGDTASVIAQELGCSQNTISGYRSRILKKLNLKSRSDLTRYVVTHNLV